ncbi:hypothetical protein QOT17_005946 [Balamuthia mandrillaris]
MPIRRTASRPTAGGAGRRTGGGGLSRSRPHRSNFSSSSSSSSSRRHRRRRPHGGSSVIIPLGGAPSSPSSSLSSPPSPHQPIPSSQTVQITIEPIYDDNSNSSPLLQRKGYSGKTLDDTQQHYTLTLRSDVTLAMAHDAILEQWKRNVAINYQIAEVMTTAQQREVEEGSSSSPCALQIMISNMMIGAEAEDSDHSGRGGEDEGDGSCMSSRRERKDEGRQLHWGEQYNQPLQQLVDDGAVLLVTIVEEVITPKNKHKNHVTCTLF